MKSFAIFSQIQDPYVMMKFKNKIQNVINYPSSSK